MLPGKKCLSAAADGTAWSADSAFRTTVRDFRYSAGFQIGRPNGCSILIAWRQHRLCVLTHILPVFEGDTFVIAIIPVVLVVIVIFIFDLFNDIMDNFIDDAVPSFFLVFIIIIGSRGIDGSRAEPVTWTQRPVWSDGARPTTTKVALVSILMSGTSGPRPGRRSTNRDPILLAGSSFHTRSSRRGTRVRCDPRSDGWSGSSFCLSPLLLLLLSRLLSLQLPPLDQVSTSIHHFTFVVLVILRLPDCRRYSQ